MFRITFSPLPRVQGRGENIVNNRVRVFRAWLMGKPQIHFNRLLYEAAQFVARLRAINEGGSHGVLDPFVG
jgi:hypothetical protein